MSQIIRPRRSALYMPAANPRALAKAASLDADVLLLDLEDAVSPNDKALAREQLLQALTEHDYGQREKIVRINGINSPWGQDDVKALKGQAIEGLLIPKLESIEQVNEVLALFDQDIAIWAMIETPKGVLNVERLAAHPSVQVLVLGTNDLAKEMAVDVSENREVFAYTFGRVIMAAKAFGLTVLDGVFNQLDNEPMLTQQCQQAKMLGFDGKTLIHPKQLQPCNQAFSPGHEQVAKAQALLEAWQQHDGSGVLVHQGEMVEALHIEQAEKLLAQVGISKE